VLANMVELTREGKWQAVWSWWWTGQFLKMCGGYWLAEELWGYEGGLCCVGLIGWLDGLLGCFVSWLVGWLHMLLGR
jgi:hypothetical protein